MNRYQGKRETPRPEPQRRPALPAEKSNAASGGGKTPAGKRPPNQNKNKRTVRVLMILGIVLAVILALVLVVQAVWNSIVKPPEITTPDTGTVDPNDPNLTEEERLGLLEEGVAVNEELPEYIANQKEGVYTFLLIGRTTMDDNSDMLMLIVFDTNTGEVNACSIPRDTLINVSSGARKINLTIWSGVEYTKNWVRKTLGVYPNFYVMVDWQAVGDLVDAVGGVTFDVPIRMHYIDPTAGFTIDLQPGEQLLDGDKAMQLIRWRKNNVYQWEINEAREAGFDGSNTKRTEMQQQFIVEAAKQILQLKNLKYLGSMVEVFKENVETDLSIGNLAWFAQKALELDSANKVTFHTLPANYNGSAYCAHTKNYQSYVTFQQSALVELVNTYLNPYESSISLSDLDLMRINSDGTLSSSTGSVVDSAHNQMINDVNSGLADIVRQSDGSYVVVYREQETEDPDTSGETTDPADPGTVTNPDAPGTATDPENPDASTDPENPDGTETTDPGGTTDPEGGEDAQTPGDETGESGGTDDPSDPNSPNYDPWHDPNYNPDPWADQRKEQSAA